MTTRHATFLKAAFAFAILPSAVLAATPPAAEQNTIIGKGTAADLTPFLVDGQGRTLYVLTGPDQGGKACDAKCLESWEAVTTAGRPVGNMVLPGLLGTVDTAGAKQVTYMGKPLYRFKQDAKPGDVKGQGFQQAAYVVSVLGQPQVPQAPIAAAGPVTPEVVAAGKALFAANCAACHGAEGEGAFGTKLQGFQRLADGQAIAHTILGGMNTMPGFASTLSDTEVAAVATFIRNSWGNDFGAVSAEQVKAQR